MLPKNPKILTVTYLGLTMLIGLFVVLLPLYSVECEIISSLQTFAQETIGILFFRAATYLGDLYLWAVLGSIYFFFAYFKARKHFRSAFELAAFLIIVTVITYLLKIGFARPRPSCPDIIVYEQEGSFSYPSGHASRATGAFWILSGRGRIKKSLAIIAIFLVFLSRIVLGVHYPTDIVGGIFLSLAVQQIADLAASSLKHF